MEPTIAPFVRKSLEVNNTILQAFEDKLGLPAGALMERHKMEEFSGSETRVIRTPPCPASEDQRQLVGSHTDFGSLVCLLLPYHCIHTIHLIFQSFLHNRLGGLQVLVPGLESWQYIKVRCDISFSKHIVFDH
jgi:hypothetical protein